MLGRKSRIEIKSPAQLELMRKAGLVVAQTLQRIKTEAGPGVTTNDLDRIAREELKKTGAESSFLGYYGYPAVICASVNDEVVHGIPNDRVLQSGDILSIDFGASIQGWHGDAAISIEIGTCADEIVRLSAVTKSALWFGISKAIAGNRLSDISHSVEQTIRSAGDYGILEEFVGHGIGSKMHMEPSVPNYGPAGKGPELIPGMAIAIEPMVTLGERHVHTLEDDWTVVTDDHSWASHWEHTVAITEDGPWVLTALDGGGQYFAANGIASPAISRA